MERTLDIMMEELERVREERKPLYEAVNVLDKEIAKLKDEITRYKLDNGLYHPISELENYKGREIIDITLVERNEDGALETEYIYGDEMFEVDKNGHLDFSSYNCGVMSYDEKIGKYVEYFHYCREEHDYVGFLDITLRK